MVYISLAWSHLANKPVSARCLKYAVARVTSPKFISRKRSIAAMTSIVCSICLRVSPGHKVSPPTAMLAVPETSTRRLPPEEISIARLNELP